MIIIFYSIGGVIGCDIANEDSDLADWDDLSVSQQSYGRLPLVILFDKSEIAKLDRFFHRDGVADLASSPRLELDS